MNVGQLLLKIKDLIAAFKAGNYLAAALTAWEIVQAFLNSIPQQELGKPRAMHAVTAGFDPDSASIDECIDELDKCCNDAAVTALDANAPVKGGGAVLISIFGPILLALVRKWFGV